MKKIIRKFILWLGGPKSDAMIPKELLSPRQQWARLAAQGESK